MAATTFETNQYKAAPIFAAGFPGVIDRTFTITLDTLTGETRRTWLDGDVIKLVKLPQGAKVLYARLECDVFDGGNGTLAGALQVYDGTTTKTLLTLADGYFEASSIKDTRDAGSTAVDKDAIGFVTDNANYYVRLVINAGTANTQQAASAALQFSIGYSMAVESDEYIRDFPTPNP